MSTKAKQIDEKFIAPQNPKDGKLGVTLTTEVNGGFRLVAEWFSAPAAAGTFHCSSQSQDHEGNTSISAANARPEPSDRNNDNGRHETTARVPRISVSAQTPIQRFLGSSGDSSAAENASIRSRCRSAHIADSDSEHMDFVAVKEGMPKVSILLCICADHR